MICPTPPNPSRAARALLCAASPALLLWPLACGGNSGSASSGTTTTTPPSSPFSKVVFLGDSLTAGYQNGSLLDTQQVNGYPNLVAQQAGFAVTLPLIASPGIPAVLQLQAVSPFPVITQASGTSTGRDNPTAQATDLAVPGFWLGDLLNRKSVPVPSSGEDLYADLVLGYPTSASTAQTEVTEAASLAPTVIFLWAGSNDALAAVGYGDPGSMTSATQFAASFQSLLSALTTQTSAKLVVANVPDVTRLPSLTRASVLAGEVAAATGVAPTTVEGELGLAADDLVNPTGVSDVEDQASKLGSTGTFTTLPANEVLTVAEQAQVQSTTNAYNQAIAQSVSAAGGVLVDIHAYFTQIGQGITINGYTATDGFLGGLFSLDGTHPTNTGYALVANQFIQATNTAWGLSTPTVDVSKVAAADPYFPTNLQTTVSRQMAEPAVAGAALNRLLGARRLRVSAATVDRTLGSMPRR